MKHLIILFLMLSLSSLSSAQSPKHFVKEIRSDFKLEKLKGKHLKDIKLKVHSATIFTILAHVQEHSIHQMNGETKNQVFLHKDGHQELVYGADEMLVDSCPNKGTYNYYHPFEKPLGHFAADILPWLMWGSCRDDSSTVNQRIEAYMLDFRVGFENVQRGKKGFFLPNKFKFKEHGQSETISFFLKALQVSNYDLNSFVPKNINERESQEQFFKAIEQGFKELINNV